MAKSIKEDYKKWLGRKVTVLIDRPIGSVHPDYPGLTYPVNYGFVPGTVSDIDHEEIDAYVLNAGGALKKFTGNVVAVLVRDADEIKLIVSSTDMMTAKEIEQQVNFQEKYFPHHLIMAGQ